MAFTNILAFVCLVAVFTECYAGSYAGTGGFGGVGSFAGAGSYAGGFPQWSFGGLPFQQPMRPGFLPFQQIGLSALGAFPNLNQIPGGVVNGMTVTSTNNGDGPQVGLSSLGSFSNLNPMLGGSLNGMTVTSTSNEGPQLGFQSFGTFSNLNSNPGGMVNGMTMTSSSNGGGLTVFSSNVNGEKHTYVSDPSKPGSFKEITWGKDDDQTKE